MQLTLLSAQTTTAREVGKINKTSSHCCPDLHLGLHILKYQDILQGPRKFQLPNLDLRSDGIF